MTKSPLTGFCSTCGTAGVTNHYHGENLQKIETKNGTLFNHISTLFTIGISSENTQDLVFQNNDYIVIKFEISSLKIASALGYLGSENIVDTTEIKIPFMENLNSKNFEINDSEFELLIKNGIGIDAQLKLNKIEFKILANTASRALVVFPMAETTMSLLV